MADILIRDVPDHVLAAVDARAKRLGLSRSEFLRRTLERESADRTRGVTMEDLTRFANLARDLDDPELMGDAWS